MLNNIVGYSGFKSYGDKPYSMMKPGQTKMDRDYYKDATTEKPDGDKVLKNFGRFQSVYDQNQATNVKLGDYKVPAKSMNTMLDYDFIHKPQLFNSTKLGRDQANAGIQPSMNRSVSSKNAAFKSMSLTAAGETVAKNANPTAHWGSTYKNVNDVVDASEKIKSRRPLWSINRQAYSSSRGRYMTEFGDAYGKHGHNPRDILPNEATK